MSRQDIVRQYAELSLAADTFGSAGMPVPFELGQAIRQIEDRARQTLTPEQMRSAMAHVSAAKTRILNEEQERRHVRMERSADDLMRDLTKGMLGQEKGLNREQFARVRQGKDVTFKSNRPTFDPVAADKKIREQTRHLDPKGKGFGLREWERRMEQLAAADEDRFGVMARQYAVPAEKLREGVERWKSERYDYEMRKREGLRDEPREHTAKTHDDDHRRAQIIGAYVDTVDVNDNEQTDQLFNGISSSSLEDDGMRGDIARAFAEVESRDAYEE